MTDAYTRAVNTGLTKTLAKKLGLPRPAMLRRHQPGAFAKPVLLPSTVDVAITPVTSEPEDGFAFVGWNAARMTRHFTGRVTPLA